MAGLHGKGYVVVLVSNEMICLDYEFIGHVFFNKLLLLLFG